MQLPGRSCAIALAKQRLDNGHGASILKDEVLLMPSHLSKSFFMETDIHTPRPRNRWWLWWVLIVLALCGCTASPTALTHEVSPTATEPDVAATLTPSIGNPTATPLPDEISDVTPTATPSPSDTPLPPVDTVPAVDYPVCEGPSGEIDAGFVADLGLPDGAAIPPSTPFHKTWRIRNTGSCTWPEGTELVHISGDTIPGPSKVPVSPADPGGEVDIVVDLEAPTRPGKYASFWRLQMAGGHLFGAVVYLEVIVSMDAAPPATLVAVPPTPSPTITATPAPTETPMSTPTEVPPPAASPTAPVTPTPAATPLPTPSPDLNAPCQDIDPRFGPLVYQANTLGIGLPCVTGPISTESGLVQFYWQDIDGSDPRVRFRGLVVVRSNTKTIYVLDGRDPTTYRAEARAYEDTWTETMPDRMDACAPIIPPAGYMVPTQAIGKVWCEQSLWNSVGWPDAAAQPAILSLQGSRSKLLIEITAGSAPPYLVAIDLEARAGTVYQSP